MLRKVLSLILVMTMTVTGLNLDMMSESIYAIQKQREKHEKTEEKVTVVKELTNEQIENTNTYLMSDGSKKLEIYGDNIRYKEKGRWRNYDNTLDDIVVADKKKLKAVSKKLDEIDADEYVYVNKQGDSKQYFAEVLDEEHPLEEQLTTLKMQNKKLLILCEKLQKQNSQLSELKTN